MIHCSSTSLNFARSLYFMISDPPKVSDGEHFNVDDVDFVQFPRLCILERVVPKGLQ